MGIRKNKYWKRTRKCATRQARIAQTDARRQRGCATRHDVPSAPEESAQAPQVHGEVPRPAPPAAVRPATPPSAHNEGAAAQQTPTGSARAPLQAVTSTPRTRGDAYIFEDLESSPIRPMRNVVNQEPEQEPLTGRRIVRIHEFLKQIQSDRHPGGMGCTFMDCKFQKETLRGFESSLYYKCSVCNKETVLKSDVRDPGKLDVNKALVIGALAGGGGFANLEEMAGAADMPCMAQSTYIMHERKVGRVVEASVLESMLANSREERRLAIEAGDLAPDGTPRIIVIADGMWCKRSYGNKYDALSGFACIIGLRTGKVLFYGVRNKHCYVCALAASKNRMPKDHVCCKNFQGSSTQMETSIILEGFKISEEMHGLRFHQLVADRDSSVYNAIVSAAPYGLLETVQKVNCKNHLLRNYRSWVLALSKDTKLPLPEGVDSKDRVAVKNMRNEMCRLRGVIGKNVLRLSGAINKASEERAKMTGTLRERTEGLRQDIRNVASHVFGDHTGCASYFCKTVQARAAAAEVASTPSTSSTPPSEPQVAPPPPEENLVPRLQQAGLWRELTRHLEVMATHADSLIRNLNNNPCEITNSVVAKFLAGKRICYSRLTSFNTRCSTATLAMNTSGRYRQVIHKAMQKGASPGKYTATHSTKKTARLLYQRSRRALLRSVKRRAPVRRQAAGPDAHYGLGAALPPVVEGDPDDPEPPRAPLPEDPDLQIRTNAVLERLRNDQENREAIWAVQQGTDQWRDQRRLRLTAANFGAVCRRMVDHSAKKLIFRLVHESSRPTSSMRHGSDTEEAARRHYERKHGVAVETRGLVVDRTHSFLGASPDGLIGDDTILEIKCPTSTEDFASAVEAVKAKKLENVQLTENGDLELKKTRHHFYQVQGQLHILQRDVCIYYLYQTRKSTVKGQPGDFLWDAEIIVRRDEAFWREKMESALVSFYHEALLPEIASPRYTIRREIEDIREPQCTLLAREARLRMAEQKQEAAAKRKREAVDRERKRQEQGKGRKRTKKVVVTEGHDL